MATIEPYNLATGGKRYRVRYRTPDYKQTDRRGFLTLREAKAFAASVEVSKMRGDYVAPADGRATIGELGPGWLQRRAGHVKPSTYRPLETAWRVHVEPRWGSVHLSDVRPTDVQSWVSLLASSRGATVVIRAFGVLAGIIDDAVADRRLAMNPARGTKLPRKARRSHTYLSHEQVREFANQAGDRGALILLLSYTGLRWGEATALQVRDLDLLRRRLTVNRNAVRSGGHVHVGTPKSGKSRTVPLPRLLVEPIARQCEGKSALDLVFPNFSGSYLRPGKWWESARLKAGLPALSPHDLRHSAASLAVSAGANVKVVQRMLGHASAAMTLDVYADLFADDLDAVSDQLDRAAESIVGKMWARGGKNTP